ncbi:MAG: DinB family protein [Bacteroidota bacterium]|nr:DinB family protein [Bacteroidota bacterium]
MQDTLWTVRPATGEYNAFYQGYVNAVPDGDLLELLASQIHTVQQVLGHLTVEQSDHRYAPEKWSIRQVFGHMVDTEWVFGYRLLRFSRGDETPLPGMDQNVFVEGGRFETRGLDSMLAEFSGLRTATLALMDSLQPDMLDRKGEASGFPITVRALGWIIAGHCQHHLNILRDRYGIELP